MSAMATTTEVSAQNGLDVDGFSYTAFARISGLTQHVRRRRARGRWVWNDGDGEYEIDQERRGGPMHAIWYFLDYKTDRIECKDRGQEEKETTTTTTTATTTHCNGWSTGYVCLYVCMYVRKTVQLKSGKRSLYGSGPCRPYEDMSFSA